MSCVYCIACVTRISGLLKKSYCLLFFRAVPIIPDVLYKLKHPEILTNTSINGALYKPAEEHARIGRDKWIADAAFTFNTTDYNVDYSRQVNTTEVTTVMTNTSRQPRPRNVINENIAVGLMFASKPIMQFITNPCVGHITNRFFQYFNSLPIAASFPLYAKFEIGIPKQKQINLTLTHLKSSINARSPEFDILIVTVEVVLTYIVAQAWGSVRTSLTPFPYRT